MKATGVGYSSGVGVGYAAQRVKDATSITIEVVKKIADQVGFQVLPRR